MPQKLSKPWALVACQGEPIPKLGFLPLEAQQLLPTGPAGAWLSTHLGWLTKQLFPRIEVQAVHEEQERDGLGGSRDLSLRYAR